MTTKLSGNFKCEQSPDETKTKMAYNVIHSLSYCSCTLTYKMGLFLEYKKICMHNFNITICNNASLQIMTKWCSKNMDTRPFTAREFDKWTKFIYPVITYHWW